MRFALNPWVIVFFLLSLAASNAFTWWETAGYEQSMCMARVRLATRTVMTAQARLRNRVNSEQYVRAMARSQAARLRDDAYASLLEMVGRSAGEACDMPKGWWIRLHEVK